MVVFENDSIWTVAIPHKGQHYKFVTDEHGSFTAAAVGLGTRDLPSGELPPRCHRAATRCWLSPLLCHHAFVVLEHRDGFAAFDYLQCLLPTHRMPDFVMAYCVGEAVPGTEKSSCPIQVFVLLMLTNKTMMSKNSQAIIPIILNTEKNYT